MELTPRTLSRTLLALAGGAALAVGLQAHEGIAGTPAFRYTLATSAVSPDCRYDYIELGPVGRTLTLTPAAGSEADDGAALLELQRPFDFYQAPQATLVVSGNGYLAAAGSLAEDDGSDFSNDCPLPAAAGNAVARHERIYVYHDDLRPRRDGGGQVRQAHYQDCPRSSAQGRTEPCTVVEWNGFERSGPLLSTQPLRAQAVLYHDSREIALQYASLDDSRAGSATIGVQGFGGREAAAAACNVVDAVRTRRAVCFFDTRSPPPGEPPPLTR